MKKIRMGLMAIAALTGLGSAFAQSPKPLATTYYARQTAGNGFHWTKTVPNPSTAQCLTVTSRVCQISTTTAPSDNQIPAGHDATDHVFVTL
ncbi:hypothetical protein SNE25_08960 [Mucilaginibacter sabulilitoris]|uniref:Secreted protein n=1 Tax=Mucilaginibacter sabulilitoris TaxID=1173583 RepID=A0ABZ0TT45_9SPHI|nr:hypothetical protein [Mucilaginibacter sabulilitoris]WPU95647.1 hypothetical protein SNE25_08960 [Mucilaginibacter sabulilitoris]